MGAYTYLTVADYPLFATMNSYSQELINLIFQPEDFIIENRKFSAKSKLFWGDTYKNEKATFRFKGFKQTAKICKERLEIFGMTLQRAKKEFPLAKKISVEEGYYDFALSKVTFNQYQNEISDIISKGDISYNQLYTNLRESLITGDLGILGQSLECQLYSILRVVPEDSVVEYDFTDVILGGWLKETDVRQVSFEKILILTEGKTDVEFIRDSIKKMYPYLSPYYHFIDFKGYTVESNASALVKMVTSLAASNIRHPIIVLFDNDTAGIIEMDKLKSIRMGNNFKILKLPDIKLAKNYPTTGPTGTKKMNVNGLACGIEMYLGIDSLTKEGKLIPIRWTSYMKPKKTYQGEISEKEYVQKKFREILKSELNHDFSDMDLLLRNIFKAFQDYPQKKL